MAEYPVLIDGKWRPAKAAKTFQAVNPATGEPLPEPIRSADGRIATPRLSAAAEAAIELRRTPPEAIARFLTRFADRIEAGKTALVEQAHLETALPKSPRLADVELPRTTGQLRQAADAALEGSWALPTIDTKNQIRSCFEPIGPVVVFGPNNFPYAFSGVAGGRFRGGHRRRQSRHRQGTSAASGHRPVARRSGGCRAVATPGCRRRRCR